MQHGTKVESCAACGSKDVLMFDSAAELGRWHELKLLVRGKQITNLRRQISFDLMASGDHSTPKKVCSYKADFVYEEYGDEVIEDVKGGAIDPVAAFKLKFMAAMGKPVRIVQR